MAFDPILADRRFGTGLAPGARPPASVDEMLARLTGPDLAAEAYPIDRSAEVTPSYIELRELRQARDGTEAGEAAFRAGRDRMHDLKVRQFARTLARGATTQDGFRERLCAFWADHFTVVANNGFVHHMVAPYVEEAIRPHVAGRFGDMLVAAVTHPMMVLYLDQGRSVGPGSEVGLRTGRGLNENLAREVLELHTVGAGGPYTQGDVRQLAELLTGLTWAPERGLWYRPRFAEPGAETVLGTTFAAEAELATIEEALRTIALHPATAGHVAAKLARHFVADRPDAALVEAMTRAWTATGGDLMAVYAAMLSHPAAWGGGPGKVLTAFDFLQSALRALAVDPDALALEDLRRHLYRPLQEMGQEWQRPPGPDGWPEEAEAWITPQGMAGRITWAMQVPANLVPDLPDPRDFVVAALGPDVPQDVAFAARAAEDRMTGVGLVLASAAFQRRG